MTIVLRRQAQICLYILLLFPILCENIVSTAFGSMVSTLFSVASCCLMLLVVLVHRVRCTAFIVIVALLMMLRVYIYFFLRSAAVTVTVANNMISPIGLTGYMMLFLFIGSHLRDRAHATILFRSMMAVMTIGVLVNFFITGNLRIADNISTLLQAVRTGYTNDRVWLFGHRNMIGIHHFMWIAFSYISRILEHRSYSRLFTVQTAFTMLVAIVSWNSTMMLTTALFFVFAIFRNTLFAKIGISHYILVYLCLEIGIVFLRVQDIFAFIIVDVFHRNLSFTGRTQIWDYYIGQFMSGDLMHKAFGNFGFTLLTVNSHNMFLGLLAFTGILGLMLYLAIVFFAAYRLHVTRTSDVARFLSICVFIFLVNSLTMEFYLQPLVALYLGYHAPELTKLVASTQRKGSIYVRAS